MCFGGWSACWIFQILGRQTHENEVFAKNKWPKIFLPASPEKKPQENSYLTGGSVLGHRAVLGYGGGTCLGIIFAKLPKFLTAQFCRNHD